MGGFWLRILGVDTARIPDGARAEVVFLHAPSSWHALLALAAVGAGIWLVLHLYRKEGGSCSRGWRHGLAGLRIASVAVLLLAILGPVLAVSLESTVEPYVLLLLDDSQSMSIRDPYADADAAARTARVLGIDPDALRADPPRRADVVDTLLQRDNGAFLRALSGRGRVRVLSYSDRVRFRQLVGVPPTLPGETMEEAPPVPPLVPEGAYTNTARGIREALAGAAGVPVAGVILVTDGVTTAGGSPLEAAMQARGQGAPVFAIGIGDPSPVRNVRVMEVAAPARLFRGDPLLIRTTLSAEGFAGETIPVELLRRDAMTGGEAVLLGREMVTIPQDRRPVQTEFRLVLEEPGEAGFLVRVPPQENETLLDDNERGVEVDVLREQARVLLIAGGPSWEYRHLRNMLIRDTTIDVSCWLQTLDPVMRQEGNTVITALPAEPAALFEYDAILLLDPEPTDFDEAWIDMLGAFLREHAGGMLFVAGGANTFSFLNLPRTQGIRDLLPVRFDDDEAEVLRGIGQTVRTGWPIRIRAAGVDHPVLRLGIPAQEAQAVWERRPVVFGSYPAREVKPGAQLLVDHPDPAFFIEGRGRPLLVAGQYGPGRTLYLGFPGTWRFRSIAEGVVERFWVQSIRFLMEGRLAGGQRQGRLMTDADVYGVGQPVRVHATVYDAAFQPLEEASLTLTLTPEGAEPETVTLRPIPERPGSYEGHALARVPGAQRMEMPIPGAPEPIRHTYAVEMPQVEFADPRLDEAALRELTRVGGGAYLPVDEWEALAGMLPDRREVIRIPGRPVPLWDTNRLLLLLVLLLSLEWGIRKWKNLL